MRRVGQKCPQILSTWFVHDPFPYVRICVLIFLIFSILEKVTNKKEKGKKTEKSSGNNNLYVQFVFSHFSAWVSYTYTNR